MSSPPPRFLSGGAFHIVGIPRDDTIFPDDAASPGLEQHHLLAENGANHPQDAHLQQKIAQNLLTPRGIRSSHKNRSTTLKDDALLFGVDDVPRTTINPPWEQDDAAPVNNSIHFDISSQFPTMSPFAMNSSRNDHTDNMITKEHSVDEAATETQANSSYNNGPPSTKSVTFNTHDQFHSWDEQLDQLLHVDEEFFNVAHFLLEVVNVGSVTNLEDENAALYFEGDEHDDSCDQKLTPVNEGGDCGILAKIFTFQCGNPKDIEIINSRQDGSNHKRNNTFRDENKKYRLTKKLVRDFEQALKFRMENIESKESLMVGGVMERDVAEKTKEIADKVEAYGLPGMSPPNENMAQEEERYGFAGSEHVANGYAPYGDCYDINDDKGEEEEEECMRNFQPLKVEERKQPRHFPILPTDEEDGKRKEGMDENEQRFYNTFGNIATFKESTEAQRHKAQSLFKSVRKLFSDLVGPTTSTPSNEQCQIRLRQIQREIRNVERMMETSRSTEIISACVNRINKLKDEKRMFQIFKEISKIQEMLKSTESESVKKACSQRLYQLSAELNSIDLRQYEEESDEEEEINADKEAAVPADHVALDDRIVAEATGEDLGWYERAQRYVRAQEPHYPVHDHFPSKKQYPQQHQNEQYAPQQPGYQRGHLDENYNHRRYQEKQQFAPSSSPRRVLSPRNGRQHTTGISPSQYQYNNFNT